MNVQTETNNSGENNKTCTQIHNKKVPAQLMGNTGTYKNTVCIDKM